MSSESEGFAAATTPEQVLNAGGVSRRRRNLSNRKRSPSGSRPRRAQTPEPPPYVDDDAPVKVPRSKSKTRSQSYGDDERFDLPPPGDDVIEASLTISPTDLPKKKKDTVVVVKKDKEKSASLKAKQVKEQEKPVEEPEVVEAVVTPIAAEKETPAVVEDKPEKAVEVIVEIRRWWQIFKKNPTVSPPVEDKPSVPKDAVVAPVPSGPVWWPFIKDLRRQWVLFRTEHRQQYIKLRVQANKCATALFIVMVYCGIGGLIFRFTEGAFESFYKCGVKRVKRDFIDSLWNGNINLREETWKAVARRKLMEFEEQLHTAHEAGMTSYSGQRSWSFLNAVVYCLTVVTTIGYGHISPSTTTGRAITIIYAIFGIPMFLILLADFGKLFTRGIKFLWAFVRRVYYTGSCRKVRRTGPVQDVIKGVQLVYNFATNRRPSEMDGAEGGVHLEAQRPMTGSPDMLTVPHASPGMPPHEIGVPLDGSVPGTPIPETFEVDDEFNLPISVAIVVLLIYIFVGATMYYIWENWGFFESFYFVFISMSTIGFGDFVPQHPMYMMASIVYLIFGLALTSMCINVVQEKLSASFQQASAKIGATIGLHMAEEEAAMEPAEPTEVEVQETEPEKKKSPT